MHKQRPEFILYFVSVQKHMSEYLFLTITLDQESTFKSQMLTHTHDYERDLLSHQPESLQNCFRIFKE